jgi:hypothetical protein
LTYQLVLTFFGLTLTYKNIVLEEVHTLCYFGNGGFTHDEVYNMPIRYRHYHLKKISEYIDQQNEAANKKSNTLENSSKPRPKIPVPDFVTKVRAPKK